MLGAEADIQYLDNKKTAHVLGSNYAADFKSEGSYFGTVRARVGYSPIDRLLIFVTGGLAYGDNKTSATVAGSGSLAGFDWVGRRSESRIGYTFGGGVEYAFAQNWTAKAEYLYYDLSNGTTTLAGSGRAAGASPLVVKSENKDNLVRLGVNYKF